MARHDELVYGLYEKEQHSCTVEFYCYDSESLKSTGVELSIASFCRFLLLLNICNCFLKCFYLSQRHHIVEHFHERAEKFSAENSFSFQNYLIPRVKEA